MVGYQVVTSPAGLALVNQIFNSELSTMANIDTQFSATNAFVATWTGVESTNLNGSIVSFQIILATDGICMKN